MQVAEALTSDIAAGRLAPGAALPGEHQLARRFQVSRGTVRHALMVLRERQLVTAARRGAGTFVTYDHRVLSFDLGFSRALEQHGVRVVTEVLRAGDVVTDYALMRRLQLTEPRFLCFDRRRRLPDGSYLSVEASRVPLTPATEPLGDLDLGSESLVTALARVGLVASRQEIEVEAPDGAGSGLSLIPPTRMLRLTRILRQWDGQLVEFVQSWLHPDHFAIHISAGMPGAIALAAKVTDDEP
jgi:GntR family transcriptional regulator